MTRRSSAECWRANARSTVAVAVSRPSRVSALSRVRIVSAASASSPSSSASARAMSVCRTASSNLPKIQMLHAAAPSWATPSVRRSSPASSTTRAKSFFASSGRSYRRIRASTTSALARCGPGASWAMTSSSFAFGPPRVTGLEVQGSGLHGSSHSVGVSIRWRELLGALEQKSSRTRRASSAGVLRSVLENGRDRLVRLVN